MSLLKSIYNKIKRPVKWIEIKLPKFKNKEEETEKEKEEE